MGCTSGWDGSQASSEDRNGQPGQNTDLDGAKTLEEDIDEDKSCKFNTSIWCSDQAHLAEHDSKSFRGNFGSLFLSLITRKGKQAQIFLLGLSLIHFPQIWLGTQQVVCL